MIKICIPIQTTKSVFCANSTHLLRTCNIFQQSNLKDTLISFWLMCSQHSYDSWICDVSKRCPRDISTLVRDAYKLCLACTFNFKVSYNLIFESNIYQARQLLCIYAQLRYITLFKSKHFLNENIIRAIMWMQGLIVRANRAFHPKSIC